MGKAKKPAKSRDVYPKVPAAAGAAPPPVQTHAFRETVESIVIAFVLAFLFRTFEAEAFVIPTGSMAPTLMGRHKDVECPKCGYRYQVSASEEDSDNSRRMRADTVAGQCPMCNYVLPMMPNLPHGTPADREAAWQRSYNGDRILVNKYIYTFAEPERWDVVVFKFPGDAQMNYIKRLVGLPGETLRIYQGDLFNSTAENPGDEDFEIIHKPVDKVLALRQLVHDTNYDPAELEAAGWPLRWQGDRWEVEKSIADRTVQQRYLADGEGEQTAWLRYRHVVPPLEAWQLVAGLDPDGRPAANRNLRKELERYQVPRLITDANPYNAREDSLQLGARRQLAIDVERQGLHWVGDLMMEANVEVQAAEGELLLDLVEGGRNFTYTIDLSSGKATLSADRAPDFAPQADTRLHEAGKYRVAFANVDDRLLLWVDGDLIEFGGSTAYDVDQVFGDRREVLPRTADEDGGDLAPAGVGARSARLAVSRLRLWRDIYYIADDWHHHPQRGGNIISDYDLPADLAALPYKPSLWDAFDTRRHADFRLGEDQFFVMGDNSAESADARLWFADSGRGGRPGGDYLERRLLIGKALCVYWPHSWNRIPGTPIPFPLFPNFADMRLVR